MKNKLITLLTILAMVFALAACGSPTEPLEESAEEPAEVATEEAAEGTSGTTEFAEGILIDETAGTVSVKAHVNGMFFDQSTMHCVVFKDGGAGDMAMMAADADSQDFYKAMMKIGGEPWNTEDKKLEDGEFTDGQKVDVTITWEGKDSPVKLSDALKTDDGRPEVDMRFSGNQANNAEAGSGCVACMNSCWAGICSNAAYAFGAIDAGNPRVYLDDSVMPADGTEVQVIFALQ